MQKKQIHIYDISHFQRDGSEHAFYANTLSGHFKEHPFVMMPHMHNFFVSILFTSGSGTHIIDFNKYAVKAGTIFTLFPGQVHDWALSDDIEGYIIFHTSSFFDLNFTFEKVAYYPFFNSIHNAPMMRLKSDCMERIKNMFQDIVNEYKCDALMKFRKICSALNVLYIELTRFYLPHHIHKIQNENHLKKVKQLDELINSNFRSIKFPRDYARLMNMSEKHLNRICKELLNHTTSEHITTRVILEAKRMLVQSTYSISEIAENLGYIENSYFFRFFKKNTGATPTQFINKFR